jgi:hypothetical protein
MLWLRISGSQFYWCACQLKISLKIKSVSGRILAYLLHLVCQHSPWHQGQIYCLREFCGQNHFMPYSIYRCWLDMEFLASERVLSQHTSVTTTREQITVTALWRFVIVSKGMELLHQNPITRHLPVCASPALLIETHTHLTKVLFWNIKTQFVLHRRHITSPLQSPAS